MAAMTLDHLSGGRAVIGVGASGPQVVEGWYGQPYPRPLARTREYVRILRDTIAREKVAAEGPKNVALAAEIADGWQPLFYAPRQDAHYRESLEAGFGTRGGRPDGIEVVCMVQVVDDDVEASADRVRPFLALYIGGMGPRGAHVHYDVFARMGYPDDCAKIQDLYLDGRKDDPAAAVPTSMVEQIALVGPEAKIAEELPVFRDSLITTMVVDGSPEHLQRISDLVD
ncbi:MAG: LLM class flavin-dependent oxidoreductase [Actinomycetota bacterium]|nr:LLM class flavin-dependent oxidoreductase [Actinomycetota bacterium]